MIKKICFYTALLVFSFNVFAQSSATQAKIEKQNFINQLVEKNHFNRISLEKLFASLHVDTDILTKVKTPFEKVTWGEYRTFFITPNRIHLGAAYWRLHQKVLLAAEKKYHVPAAIIVAIIGVESDYGLHLGDDTVINTLYTLAFYGSDRASFFRKELYEFLILARSNHLNPIKLKGSYAGAVGIPQFMPSSYRIFGVSYKKGQPVDLFHNDADAIMSVANYFHQNGWMTGQPIAEKVTQTLYKQNKYFTRLTMPKGEQFWRLYHNFYVIMRYNHSINYAMVIDQLSEAIKRQYEAEKRSCAVASARPAFCRQKTL